MEPSPRTPRTPRDELVRAERHLHLGVLAHVDAGKTSLTEALLLAGGALTALGRVDAGTTVTDSLALERRRGITIRAAVATFRAGAVLVDLVDTPGHPDFIAEVDRSLSVLDAAVLVVSAVEGVQAQTVVLHRALRRLSIPTVVFVNKIDRAGADPQRVVAALRERLDLTLVELGGARDPGRSSAAFVPARWDDPRTAETVASTLAERDDTVLATWLEHGLLDAPVLWSALGRLTRSGAVVPLVLGSARTGAGVRALVEAVTGLLVGDDPPNGDAPLDGQVFKVEHDDAGRRVCTVLVRAGSLGVRDRVHLGVDRAAVVTGLRVFEPGGTSDRQRVVAGEIARVTGLAAARVGDPIGVGEHRRSAPTFPPPALQTTVVARDPGRSDVLHRALVELADVDPLIRVRPDLQPGALRIDVYGEVQREVLADTLADEFGVLADFSPPVAACVERLAGRGRAARRLGEPGHHRLVTLGVTVAPGPPGRGVQVLVTAERATLPLHVYGTVDGLRASLLEHVGEALAVGPHGWPVVDVAITVTRSGYPPSGPSAADVRHTFATVVAEAVRAAGTVVCEPVDRFSLETPTDTVAAALGLLLRHRAVPGSSTVRGGTTVCAGTIPSAEVDAVRAGLPTAAHGLAVLESTLDHYSPALTGL